MATQNRSIQSRHEVLASTMFGVALSSFIGVVLFLAAPWAEEIDRILGIPLPPHDSSVSASPHVPIAAPTSTLPVVVPGSIAAIRETFMRCIRRLPGDDEVVGRIGQPPARIETEICESLEARRIRSGRTDRPLPSFSEAVVFRAFYVTWASPYERQFNVSITNAAHTWSLAEGSAVFSCDRGATGDELGRVALPEILAGQQHTVSIRLSVASTCNYYSVTLTDAQWVLPPGMAE